MSWWPPERQSSSKQAEIMAGACSLGQLLTSPFLGPPSMSRTSLSRSSLNLSGIIGENRSGSSNLDVAHLRPQRRHSSCHPQEARRLAERQVYDLAVAIPENSLHRHQVPHISAPIDHTEHERKEVAENLTQSVDEKRIRDKTDAYNFQKYGFIRDPLISVDSDYDFIHSQGPTIEQIFEPECVRLVRVAMQKCKFGQSMPISEFRVWFDAIRSNDIPIITTILEDFMEEERNRLLNAPFAYNVQNWKSSDVELGKLFFLPTILAAAFQAVDALEVLYKNGASIYSRDVGGNNIFHALCQLSSFVPTQEANYVLIFDHVLRMTNDPIVWKRMLFTENEQGLRPLEMAAKLGTFSLFDKIINTEGVYKTYLGNFGLFHTAFFDMTEYEFYGRDNRRMTSPLRFFLYLQRSDLKREDCQKLMNSELMRKWMAKSVTETRPYLILWFIFRVVLVTLFFLLSGHERLEFVMEEGFAGTCSGAKDQSEELPLSPSVYQTIVTVCILTSGCVITFDILEVFVALVCKRSRRQLHKRPGANGQYIVQWALYRTLHIIMIMCMFCYLVLTYLHSYHGINIRELRTYMGVMHTVVCFLVTWSFLYFAQFLPFMSYFVLALQRLLPTVCTCGSLFLVLYASFSTAVYYLEGYPCHIRGVQYLTGMFSSLSSGVNATKAWQNEEGTVILLYILFSALTFIFTLAFISLVIIFAIKLSSCKDVDVIRRLQCYDAAATIDHRIGWLVYSPCRQSKSTKHGIFYVNEATKDDNDNVSPGSQSQTKESAL